jgi:hypothetical protein
MFTEEQRPTSFGICHLLPEIGIWEMNVSEYSHDKQLLQTALCAV